MPQLRLFRTAATLSIIAAVVVVFFLGLTLGGLLLRQSVGREVSQNTEAPREDLAVIGTASPPPTSENSTTAPTAAKEYLLKEVHGVLVIFSENAPVRTLDLNPQLLPGATRKALTTGISTASWQDMLRLIADLGG
jgi:hypothetical protein